MKKGAAFKYMLHLASRIKSSLELRKEEHIQFDMDRRKPATTKRSLGFMAHAVSAVLSIAWSKKIYRNINKWRMT